MPTYLQLESEQVWHDQIVPPRRNGPRPKPLAERIKAAVIVDENGCWRWQRYVRSNGYGQIGVPGVGGQYVHRVAYETFVGPIPDGLQIDHLCRVRDCCNPDHLEAVTCRENLARGTGFVPVHIAKTHCPAGHPYDAENTYVRPSGTGRDCRRCKTAATTRWRRRARTA